MLTPEQHRLLLKDQIALSKMTDEECIEALVPRKGWLSIDFAIFRHCEFLWHLIHWNWFDIWQDTENADEYRAWYIRLKRRLFGNNGGKK